MRAGHQAARGTGVSEVVGAGRDRPGGRAEICGIISDKIGEGYGDGVRGGVGQGSNRGRGRRQGGVSGR